MFATFDPHSSRIVVFIMYAQCAINLTVCYILAQLCMKQLNTKGMEFQLGFLGLLISVALLAIYKQHILYLLWNAEISFKAILICSLTIFLFISSINTAGSDPSIKTEKEIDLMFVERIGIFLNLYLGQDILPSIYTSLKVSKLSYSIEAVEVLTNHYFFFSRSK